MKNLLALFALVVGLLVVSWGNVDAAPPVNNRPPDNRPPNNRPPNNRPPDNRPPNNRPPNNRPPVIPPKPPVIVPPIVVPNVNKNTNNNVNLNTAINRNANVATAINRNNNKINNDINIKLNLSKNNNGNSNSNNRGFSNPGRDLGGYGWPMGFDGYYGSSFPSSYTPPSYTPPSYTPPSYTPPSYSYNPTGGAYAPNFTYNPTYSFGGYSNPYGYDTNLLPNPNVVVNAANTDTAWITLELPDEEAEVWLNGVKQIIKGSLRKYITPPLQKEKIYNYEIKVQWPLEKGRKLGAKINYSTTISFKAGDEITHTVPPEGDGNAAAPPMPKLEQQPQDEAKLMNQRLNWAKELLKEGKTDAAKNRLKDIVNKSPDSPAGQEAKVLLDKMQ